VAKEPQKELKDELPIDLFDLDPFKLDKHFLEQPKLVMTWGIRLADAKDAQDRARAALDLARAEAQAEISAEPEKFDISKPTVDAIKMAVERHEEVQLAQTRLQKRQHDVNVIQALMVALEHRKRAIEGLITLHGQSYFASPSVSPDQRERYNELAKRSVRRVGRADDDN
jgi:hypothetical protein